LINYTKNHFTTEEKFFQKFDYKEQLSYTLEHNNFLKKVTEFKSACGSSKTVLSIEVLIFLSDWVKNHILICDKKYSEFLNSREMK
jgi:hemerythrin-like metal-binding protein